MIRGIHHVALHTPNFDVMLKFYQDGFGFSPASDMVSWTSSPIADMAVGIKGGAARLQLLKAGNTYLELIEYSTPKSRDAGPARAQDHGYTHFCVDVTDIESEFDRLAKLGVRFFPERPIDFGGGMKAAYGKDPDGNLIEIQEVPENNAIELAPDLRRPTRP